MSNLFNTLGIGYSGLRAAQTGISTTAHNISNAENEGYTRQRVVTAASTPLYTAPGNVGNGVDIQDIKRVFDNFVFDRYAKISAEKEYSDFERQTLETLSTYFPEIDNVGIKSNLSEYYNMWQSLADNPDSDAIKVALAKQTESLTAQIAQTQEQIKTLQQQVNEQLKVNIDQVNELAKELASINVGIDTAEAGGGFSANDLRDKRNVIEQTLSKLIGANAIQDQISANMQIDSNSNTRSGSYTLSINGFNIVDGNSFHPLHISKEQSASGFYSVSYERQDGALIPMEESITGGKIGAIFDLRGGSIDTTSGMPRDGIIQETIAQFDAFAKGLIENTNNLYAEGATQRMQSNDIGIDPTDTALTTSGFNVKEGSFDMIIYDLDGNEVARRTIEINSSTVLEGPSGSNSIKGQIEASRDDNADGNANNNINNFITYNYQRSSTGELNLELIMNPSDAARGYTFAIADNLKNDNFSSGTNFAGALGLARFFDGDSARSISLHSKFQNNPTAINAGFSGAEGDNRLGLNMVQQQFESYKFDVGDASYNTTMYGMFDTTATFVGIATNSAVRKNDTVSTQFRAVEMEYHSVSKVSIDEEMTNLIKYQNSYGAAAKVITTVDQMMQTLLGLKQ